MKHMSMTVTIALAATLSLTAAAAEPTSLPADVRLDPVRQNVQQLVDRATAAGLPAEMIVSKVREGLAKGVDARRIEVAAGRLAEGLQSAHSYLAERRRGPIPGKLVRAVAEARLAGVDLAAVDALVRNDRPEAPAERAVEVVTDLSLRGYPTDRAAAVVKQVVARDGRSLDRLPGTLETIRQEYALTQTEAADALSRGLAGADSLQAAYTRTANEEQRRGRGRGGPKKGAGDGSDSPGKSGLAPGHLKMRPNGPKRK
jgi:hypothetical protein